MLDVLKQHKDTGIDADSNSSESLTGWKKNTTKQERVYILGAHQGDLDCSYHSKEVFEKVQKTKETQKPVKAQLKPTPTQISDHRYVDIVVEILDDQWRGTAIRGLLGSDCSRTIILKEFYCKKQPGEKLIYQTYGGTITSKSTSHIKLKLPEFLNSKQINFMCQVV